MALGSQPPTVAIIGGTGAAGSSLALRWARAGLSVIIGSRESGRAEAAAVRCRHDAGPEVRVEGRSNAEAAGGADLVVLTVPFAAQLATMASIRDHLRAGTVVVDTTTPLATTVGGRATQLLGVWAGSAAEQAASVVPPGVEVVAAFHHVSARLLADVRHAVDCDVLVCGDSRPAKERVRVLVEAIAGARFVDAGPLANARFLEAITPLLVGLNVRYKVHASGIRITGLDEVVTPSPPPSPRGRGGWPRYKVKRSLIS